MLRYRFFISATSKEILKFIFLVLQIGRWSMTVGWEKEENKYYLLIYYLKDWAIAKFSFIQIYSISFSWFDFYRFLKKIRLTRSCHRGQKSPGESRMFN